MKKSYALAAGLLATTVLTLPMGHVSAQEPNRGQAVTERSRPDYDALGLRAGGFLIYPELAVTAEYDDNIFAQETDTTDDYIFIARPQVRAVSDWTRHALGVRAGAEVGRYADTSAEDYEDYFILADGRLDILTGTVATARAGYQRLHEERGEANEAGGAEPTEYDLSSASLALSRDVARLTGRLTADWRSFDFEDVPGFAGGFIDQDTRDREEYGVSARLGYATSPNLGGFVQAGYNWRRYDLDAGRDSDGYSLTGGIAIDLSGVTTGEVFAGYRKQDYDNPAFDAVDGLTYGASLNWNPTPLTSIEVGISNTVEETTLAGASSFVETEYRVSVDHELLRNLIVGGYAAYAENDYEDIDRMEELYSAGVGVKYLFNRYFNVDLGYGYSGRTSDALNRDFDRNSVFLRVAATL